MTLVNGSPCVYTVLFIYSKLQCIVHLKMIDILFLWLMRIYAF